MLNTPCFWLFHIAMEAMAKFIDELPSKIFHIYVKLQMVCDSVVYVIVY